MTPYTACLIVEDESHRNVPTRGALSPGRTRAKDEAAACIAASARPAGRCRQAAEGAGRERPRQPLAFRRRTKRVTGAPMTADAAADSTTSSRAGATSAAGVLRE